MNLSQRIKWLENYKTFANKLSKTTIDRDLEKYKTLINEHNVIKKLVDDRERVEATQYNVFYILKYIVQKEEITHSPFLADLLNVHGKHRQEELFYNAFLKQIGLTESQTSKFKIDQKIYFTVKTEKWVENGSVDIFIEYNSPKKRFAIAIENKIYGQDKRTQLERYARYLEANYNEDFLLVYLTPKVRFPEMPYSISRNRFDVLNKKG